MRSLNGAPHSARFCASIFQLACFAALATHALSQDPLQRYPQNYKQVLDNAQVTVLRVHYGPHETVGVHDHSDVPTLFIYLNDSGPVRFNMNGVPPSTVVRPPGHLGAFRYSPGGVERHSVQNLGDKNSEFLRVELKQFPLKGGEDFRRDAPLSLAANSMAREFSNDQIEVERVVCMPGKPCLVPAGPLPSLVVALSGLGVSIGNDAGAHTLDLGEMQWIDANNAIRVSAAGSAPAHLLRILVKPPRQGAPVS
jgi:hypothetical protein